MSKHCECCLFCRTIARLYGRVGRLLDDELLVGILLGALLGVLAAGTTAGLISGYADEKAKAAVQLEAGDLVDHKLLDAEGVVLWRNGEVVAVRYTFDGGDTSDVRENWLAAEWEKE